jgi:hypothetical protein
VYALLQLGSRSESKAIAADFPQPGFLRQLGRLYPIRPAAFCPPITRSLALSGEPFWYILHQQLSDLSNNYSNWFRDEEINVYKLNSCIEEHKSKNNPTGRSHQAGQSATTLYRLFPKLLDYFEKAFLSWIVTSLL